MIEFKIVNFVSKRPERRFLIMIRHTAVSLVNKRKGGIFSSSTDLASIRKFCHRTSLNNKTWPRLLSLILVCLKSHFSQAEDVDSTIILKIYDIYENKLHEQRSWNMVSWKFEHSNGKLLEVKL